MTKGDCAVVVIETRVLRRGDYPALFGWVQCNHRGACKGKGRQESQGKTCDDGNRSQRQGEICRCHADDFEDGAREHKLRNAGDL